MKRGHWQRLARHHHHLHPAKTQVRTPHGLMPGPQEEQAMWVVTPPRHPPPHAAPATTQPTETPSWKESCPSVCAPATKNPRCHRRPGPQRQPSASARVACCRKRLHPPVCCADFQHYAPRCDQARRRHPHPHRPPHEGSPVPTRSCCRRHHDARGWWGSSLRDWQSRTPRPRQSLLQETTRLSLCPRHPTPRGRLPHRRAADRLGGPRRRRQTWS